MYRRILAPLLLLPLLLAGCKKSSTLAKLEEKPPAAAPSAVVAAASATASSTSTPAPGLAVDRSAKAIVLCYHRFEDKPHDTLAIAPAEFRSQMKQLKDAGIQVVAMKDFLAWRRGEKSIPPK